MQFSHLTSQEEFSQLLIISLFSFRSFWGVVLLICIEMMIKQLGKMWHIKLSSSLYISQHFLTHNLLLICAQCSIFLNKWWSGLKMIVTLLFWFFSIFLYRIHSSQTNEICLDNIRWELLCWKRAWIHCGNECCIPR